MMAWYSRARSSLSSSITLSRVMVSSCATAGPLPETAPLPDSLVVRPVCSRHRPCKLHVTVSSSLLCAGGGRRGPHQLHDGEEVMPFVEQEELEPQRDRHPSHHGGDSAAC